MTSHSSRSLSSLFRASVKTEVVVPSKAAPSVSSEGDATLRDAVKILREVPLPASCPLGRNSSQQKVSESHSGRSRKELSQEIFSILCGSIPFDTSRSQELAPESEESCSPILDIPWFSYVSKSKVCSHQKITSRERKQKWIFKNTQAGRFERMIKSCANKIGVEQAIHIFGKLGRETGLKEYNALISLCIEKARSSDDDEVRLQQILLVSQLFNKMRQQGFSLEEDSYGPLLSLLVDMSMIEKFGFFSQIIRDDNPNSISKLGYYEMLLCIKINDREKVQELCRYITSDNDDRDGLSENYLRALCEGNQKEEIVNILANVNVARISNANCLTSVFQSLGLLLLESLAVESISKLKEVDYGDGKISEFLYNFVISMPNLKPEEIIIKLKNMHDRVGLTVSPLSYEKLIRYSCKSFEVHMALDVASQMNEVGLELSTEMLNFILIACDNSYNFNLVHQIYSMIQQYKLKPNGETFKIMIKLCTRMKDFEGAYNILSGLHEMNLMPDPSLYNAIMAGYFRERNLNGAGKVLKEMESAGVKPDAQTFSYLIRNCHCEKDVIKYYEEMKASRINLTKNICMALIHAYAACGLFDKAKEVVHSTGIPVKGLNEIRSSLVSALAINGQTLDALEIYEEIKRVGRTLEPKSVFHLMENLQSEAELGLLVRLLGELDDTEYWVDGCCRVILYCVRQKDLSSAVDLMKQVNSTLTRDQSTTLFDEVFSEIAESDVAYSEFGVAMLKAMKDAFDFHPSRKCLDFLLCACVRTKDLDNCHSVGSEYESAGLPFNMISFLWMYQCLLACGDYSAANRILNKIPTDDPHVRIVISACKRAFRLSDSSG